MARKKRTSSKQHLHQRQQREVRLPKSVKLGAEQPKKEATQKAETKKQAAAQAALDSDALAIEKVILNQQGPYALLKHKGFLEDVAAEYKGLNVKAALIHAIKGGHTKIYVPDR